MHGPSPHNPLRDAARDTIAMAREGKSPLLERVALFAMIASAITGIAVAAVHTFHLLKRDMKDDRRDKDRDRRSEATPPERPEHGDTAPMPDAGSDERRWTRRQEQPQSAYARHR